MTQRKEGVAQRKLNEDKQPNIWRARFVLTGDIHYAVATYDAETGGYCPILTLPQERAGFPSFPVSFEGAVVYTDYNRARGFAIRRMGYTHIADAETNLGRHYIMI